MNRQAHAPGAAAVLEDDAARQWNALRGNTMFRDLRRILLALSSPAPLALSFAQSGPPCPRPAPGSVVTAPPELFSQNGTLNVTFNYFTAMDSAGRTLFCFVTPNGLQGPTLHVLPGDTLNVTVTNLVPAPPPGSPTEVVSNPVEPVRRHDDDDHILEYPLPRHQHSPTCHSDEVIHTVINSGESFQYSLHFPTNEPPGLYWYHPHVHGIAEAAVQGGASGAIIVGGIASFQPAVAGLPERVLVVRDQPVAGTPAPGGTVPSWDVTSQLCADPVHRDTYPGFHSGHHQDADGQEGVLACVELIGRHDPRSAVACMTTWRNR